jgi:hypothetical protein
MLAISGCKDAQRSIVSERAICMRQLKILIIRRSLDKDKFSSAGSLEEVDNNVASIPISILNLEADQNTSIELSAQSLA